MGAEEKGRRGCLFFVRWEGSARSEVLADRRRGGDQKLGRTRLCAGPDGGCREGAGSARAGQGLWSPRPPGPRSTSSPRTTPAPARPAAPPHRLTPHSVVPPLPRPAVPWDRPTYNHPRTVAWRARRVGLTARDATPVRRARGTLVSAHSSSKAASMSPSSNRSPAAAAAHARSQGRGCKYNDGWRLAGSTWPAGSAASGHAGTGPGDMQQLRHQGPWACCDCSRCRRPELIRHGPAHTRPITPQPKPCPAAARLPWKLLG